MRALILVLFCLGCCGKGFAAEAEAPPTPPAHDEQRTELEGGYTDGLGSFLSIGYRYGLHDLLDPVRGYPENTDFEILRVKVRLPIASPRFWLDDLTLVRFASLSPTELSLPERSWEVEVGGRTERSLLCDHCVAGRALAGLGATFQTGHAIPIQFFLLGDISFAYGPGFQGFALKPGIGPHGGLRWRVMPWLIAIFDGRYAYTFPADHPHVYEYGTEWRLSPARDFAVSARLWRYADAWESSISLLTYF